MIALWILGTGCGVIPLILAYRNLGKRIVGLEIQPELVDLARHNVQANGFAENCRFMRGIFASFLWIFDLEVSTS